MVAEIQIYAALLSDIKDRVRYRVISWIFRAVSIGACLGLLSVSTTGFANPALTEPINQQELARIKTLLAIPEDKVDFAYAKLTIDQIIDPNINIDDEIHRLDRMVQDVQAMGVFTRSMDKKNALRRYLYEKGSWNRHQSFTYDFSDPKGTNIENKLLANYLTSKKGNCVSMPVLFITLGQKLGLNVTASTAPLHVFVKYTDDETGITYNLETTSGGNPARDSWLRQGFSISDLAIKNGVYMQKLTRVETVAVMVSSLLQHYQEQKQYGQVIATADLILKYYPNAVSAVIYKASAYNELLKVHGLWQYHAPMEVPAEQRGKFKYLVTRVNGYHNQAVKMGWRPPSQAENEAYLKRVKQDAGKLMGEW